MVSSSKMNVFKLYDTAALLNNVKTVEGGYLTAGTRVIVIQCFLKIEYIRVIDPVSERECMCPISSLRKLREKRAPRKSLFVGRHEGPGISSLSVSKRVTFSDSEDSSL